MCGRPEYRSPLVAQVQNKKFTFALVCETLKYLPILDAILRKAKKIKALKKVGAAARPPRPAPPCVSTRHDATRDEHPIRAGGSCGPSSRA